MVILPLLTVIDLSIESASIALYNMILHVVFPSDLQSYCRIEKHRCDKNEIIYMYLTIIMTKTLSQQIKDIY